MKLHTNQTNREEAHAVLRGLPESRAEWLCSESRAARMIARHASGAACVPSCVWRGEWELKLSGGALHFSFWSDAGLTMWRVAGWERAGKKVVVAATRRGGAERATLELVPRLTGLVPAQ